MELVSLDVADAGLASDVLELQRRSYRVEAELIGSEAIPPFRESLDELRDCGETFLGAREANRLIGAISWRVENETLDIHRLIVDPANFRRGIASALLRKALSEATGLRRAIVQTGAANTPAIALYEREGFVRAGELEPRPGPHVVRLALDLA